MNSPTPIFSAQGSKNRPPIVPLNIKLESLGDVVISLKKFLKELKRNKYIEKTIIMEQYLENLDFKELCCVLAILLTKFRTDDNPNIIISWSLTGAWIKFTEILKILLYEYDYSEWLIRIKDMIIDLIGLYIWVSTNVRTTITIDRGNLDYEKVRNDFLSSILSFGGCDLWMIFPMTNKYQRIVEKIRLLKY